MATVKMLALAQFIASKAGATGLTVTCDVDEYNIDAATVNNAFLTAQSMTHVRNGIYRLFFDGDDTKLYTATAKTSDSSVDQQQIAAVIVRLDRVNNADALTSTRLPTASYTAAPTAAANADAVWDEALSGHATAGSAGAALSAAGGAADPLTNAVPGAYGSGTAGYVLGQINPANVSIVSPVSVDGTEIAIVRGDDYDADDGRALTFTGATWPTLTSGAVALRVSLPGGVTAFAGSVTGAQACRVELTSAQTAAIAAGSYAYDLEATLSSGRVVTLVQGSLIVAGDVR